MVALGLGAERFGSREGWLNVPFSLGSGRLREARSAAAVPSRLWFKWGEFALKRLYQNPTRHGGYKLAS
jgi:hypothetical protein